MLYTAREHARFMMQDKKYVEELYQRDLKKYGSRNGPSFETLFRNAMIKFGNNAELAGDEIVTSSARTDDSFNAEHSDC